MFLQPNKTWRWQYDDEHQSLSLIINNNMRFVSAVTGRKINQDGITASEFSCLHSQLYYQYLESLDEFDWPAPIKVQAALNALAIVEYHQPLIPQSWFFAHQGEMQECVQGEVLTLETERGDALFMAVEVEATTVLCMALEPGIFLNDYKTLNQFDAIKVMRDRIKPYSVPQALAQVG